MKNTILLMCALFLLLPGTALAKAGHGLDTNGDDLPISANGIQALSISGSDGSVTFQKSVTFQQPPILSTGVGCTPALKGSVQLTASNGLSVCNGSAWISPTPTSGFTLVKICSTATIAACTPTAASSQTNNDLTGAPSCPTGASPHLINGTASPSCYTTSTAGTYSCNDNGKGCRTSATTYVTTCSLGGTYLCY